MAATVASASCAVGAGARGGARGGGKVAAAGRLGLVDGSRVVALDGHQAQARCTDGTCTARVNACTWGGRQGGWFARVVSAVWAYVELRCTHTFARDRLLWCPLEEN